MFDSKKIISLMEPNKKYDFKTLAKLLNVKISDNKNFSKFLFDLCNKNEIMQTFDRKYYIPKFIGEIENPIRINAKGFGFVDINEDGSLAAFIPKQALSNSLNGDIVKIKYFADTKKEGAFQGVITEIVERTTTSFVGVVRAFGGNLGIEPFDKNVLGRFRFEDPKSVSVNDVVKVEISFYGNHVNKLKVIKTLGKEGDTSIDILSAIENAIIPYEFSTETLAEAHKIPDTVQPKELEGREDKRNELIVTIDGDDTKDFDDAITVKKLENGNYLLSVHIADVTHYVKEDSALDDEAKTRGTSVYLADRVIPMLPEKLSNGICSLNPNVDRLTLSSDMEIDKDGNTVRKNVYPAVINSKHRLTYKQVNKFFAKEITFEDKELEKMLNEAKELANIIRKYKNEEGYIDFEIEESQIILDDLGNTVDIVPKERGESEILIEDFMVRANETVASIATEAELSFIYRIHDRPDEEKIEGLQNVMNVLGIKTKIPSHPEPKQFAKAVESIKASRFDDFMKIMMLRTMSKAEYSPQNIGHFGLASQDYTHFTSPIRRYPDLMVHRMLREYFINKESDVKAMNIHFAKILPEISSHASKAEQGAMALERKVADIKKAEFYEQFIGKSFDGTIVSTLKFGFFVEFPNKVDGLVHLSNLTDGKYELVDNNFALSNKKRKFTVGDSVNVTVIGTSKNEGKIDLVLTEQYDEFLKNKEKVKKRY